MLSVMIYAGGYLAYRNNGVRDLHYMALRNYIKVRRSTYISL